MKATGIVRRIDDLGRVVIPKEIRRTLRIKEGDPLEIYVDRGGEIILKKYSPIRELKEFAADYAYTLYQTFEKNTFISDRDVIIAAKGQSKELVDKQIGNYLDQIMETRELALEEKSKNIELINGKQLKTGSIIVVPIISGGDVIGTIGMYSENEDDLGEMHTKAVQIGAHFLGSQVH